MSSRKNRKKFSKSPLDAPVKPESKDKKEKTFYFEPKTENQKKYVESIKKNTVTLVSGPPGSGKTFISFCMAISMLYAEKIEKIYIVRPLVALDEYGEGKKIAALTGDLHSKIKDYVMSIFDSASITIGPGELNFLIESHKIEFLPLSMIRGRSFANSVICVEEAQNIDGHSDAMRTLLTRISKNSKMIISGDIAQSDIGTKKSGLADAMKRFADTEDFGIVVLERCDIQRHGIISVILEKYEKELV